MRERGLLPFCGHSVPLQHTQTHPVTPSSYRHEQSHTMIVQPASRASGADIGPVSGWGAGSLGHWINGGLDRWVGLVVMSTSVQGQERVQRLIGVVTDAAPNPLFAISPHAPRSLVLPWTCSRGMCWGRLRSRPSVERSAGGWFVFQEREDHTMRRWYNLGWFSQVIFAEIRSSCLPVSLDTIAVLFTGSRTRSLMLRAVRNLVRHRLIHMSRCGFVVNDYSHWCVRPVLVCNADFTTRLPSPSGSSSWSRRVTLRDGRCLLCRSSKQLCAHHIRPRLTHPHLRREVCNGITLCLTCHRATYGIESSLFGLFDGLLRQANHGE
jgi:hypothetical protein